MMALVQLVFWAKTFMHPHRYNSLQPKGQKFEGHMHITVTSSSERLLASSIGLLAFQQVAGIVSVTLRHFPVYAHDWVTKEMY